ncbi:MAG: triple tyrosine motif-containing protein [Cyclobacteriaceae bacterium]
MRVLGGFIFALLISSQVAWGQSGNYFLSHHSPSDENIDYLSFDIVQNGRGVIYFANKSGVVEFDGRNWNVIEAPGAIYSLAISEGDELYVGGLTGFGKLSLDDDNNLAYQGVASANNQKNIFKCVSLNGVVYFINDANLFGYNSKTQTVEISIAAEGVLFTGLFSIAGEIYVTDSNSNLLQLKSKSLSKAALPFLGSDEILFSSRLSDQQRFLIGTSSGRIFSYDGKTGTEIKPEDSEYLSTSVIVSGKWVNENLVAMGTLSGGVVFLNPKTGATEQIINYYTGLPDNEVFAMMTDRNQGVWVAHDYGFTRIAPYLPFRTYNHYPGLSGNLLSAYSDASNVYVGTSVGLFKLNKEEIYSEETYYVTRYRKMTAEEEKEERKKSRRGLFGFLKKKDKDEEPEQKSDNKKEDVKKVVEKKTRKVLQSLDYAYKKVEGISGKVTHLIKMDGRLIVAGVGGVFEVNGLEAEELLGMPVRTVFYSPTLSQMLVSTYNDRIRTLQPVKKGWEETHLLDTLRDYVGNIFEDHVQNIWLCGRAGVIKVELLDKQVTSVSSVPFAEPVLDETMGFALGTEVFVAASGSFHQYDVVKHQFTRYDSLPGPRKYFTSLGTFWFNDGHRWRTVDYNLQNNLKLEWLGLFPDIRSLTMADDGNGLWLITSENELYKFTKSDLLGNLNNYPLFLKEVRGSGSKLSPGKLIAVDQQESALSFEFIQPEYTNALAIEYQYMIDGISKDWSEWSTSNNIVNFPFLTPGKYKLRIQSRDLFGKISELQSVDFRVVPPYWKQTWFYGLEFVFFASLVFLSLRLSAANNKYRHISQLLSILTIIMLIQLMQNTAESLIPLQTTPVLDFFIQVFIALLILPLEYKMRNFMVEASEGKYDIKKMKINLKDRLP